MDKNAVAEVLETAADLYESEKVNWCSGAWVGTEDHEAYAINDYNYTDDMQISACAEGALLRAAGYTWQQVEQYASYDANGGERSFFRAVDNPRAAALYIHARARLGDHLRIEFPEHTIKGTKYHIPGWNDELDDDDRITDPKQVVIDAFKETAKELRNG